MADRGEAWVTVGSFETVTDAARKIIELESYPVSGIFFEILIETKAGAKTKRSATLSTPAKAIALMSLSECAISAHCRKACKQRAWYVANV
jgi:hypothetical protein